MHLWIIRRWIVRRRWLFSKWRTSGLNMCTKYRKFMILISYGFGIIKMLKIISTNPLHSEAVTGGGEFYDIFEPSAKCQKNWVQVMIMLYFLVTLILNQRNQQCQFLNIDSLQKHVSQNTCFKNAENPLYWFDFNKLLLEFSNH